MNCYGCQTEQKPLIPVGDGRSICLDCAKKRSSNHEGNCDCATCMHPRVAAAVDKAENHG